MVGTDTFPIQIYLFNLIKNKLNKNLSLVDEVADLLNISNNSAYRRIRGEQAISLDEAFKLSEHFKLSLEMLNAQIQNDQVWFTFRTVDNLSFTFEQYLQSQLTHLEHIHQCSEKKLIYSAKDLPVFHYYNFDELAAFKIFVWKKAIMGLEEFEKKKFSSEEILESENIEIGRKIINRYSHIPSVEVWNDETPNSVLRQIQLYFDMGIFKNKSDARLLLDQFVQMIEHLEKQAELGYKFNYILGPTEKGATYELYNNEVVLCDNSIYFEAEEKNGVFITNNTLNYMLITNKEYSDSTHKWLRNLIKRSTLISTTSEIERRKYFVQLMSKIDKLSNHLTK